MHLRVCFRAGTSLNRNSPDAGPTRVFDTEILNRRIPAGHARFLNYFNAQDAAEDVEHAGDNALQFEVRPEFLFIEFIESDALFFGKIADVPGLNLL